MSFACLGIQALGHCTYDPSKPNIYFTLGDAIAALSLMILIPQFLKRIYRFRLSTRGISLNYVYGLVFGGALLVFCSTLIANLDLPRSFAVFYPINWELLATLLFVTAYALLAFGSIFPARVSDANLETFSKGVAEFLADGSEADYSEIADDFAINVPRLIESAQFLESHQDNSAFFEFSHRTQLRRCRFAATLLLIASDQKFCASLVCKRPWLASRLLLILDRRQLHSSYAEKLIQQLAREAILNPESLLTREVGFSGFSSNPVLSQSLFGSRFICARYNAFRGIRYRDFDDLSITKVQGLSVAAKLVVDATLHSDLSRPCPHMHQLADVMVSLFESMNDSKSTNRLSGAVAFEAKQALVEVIQKTRERLAGMQLEERQEYFLSAQDRHDAHFVAAIADMSYRCLEALANKFYESESEPFWTLVWDIMWAIFPVGESTDDLIDPLQQRVATKIISKLGDNANGMYPAISRIVLTFFGPFGSHPDSNPNSAYSRLERASFDVIKNFVTLSMTKQEILANFLPSNVTFKRSTNRLVWVYADGSTRHLDLDSIPHCGISFEVKPLEG